MPVPSESLGLADSTLVMLLHDMAFKWADGCPKTYAMLLQDLFSSNGLPSVIIPASLTDLRPLPSAAQRVREISAAIDLESCPVLPRNGSVHEGDNSSPSEITIKCEPGPFSSSSENIPETEVSPIYFPDNNAWIKIESTPNLPCNSNIHEADNSSGSSLYITEPSLTPPLPCNESKFDTVNSSPSSRNSPMNESGFKSIISNKRKSTFTDEDGPTSNSGTKCRNTVPDAYNLFSGASKRFLSDHEHEAPVSTSEPSPSAKSTMQSDMESISGINTASDHEHEAPVSTSEPAISAKSTVQSEMDFISGINTASDHEHEAPGSTSEPLTSAKSTVQSEMDSIPGINTVSDHEYEAPVSTSEPKLPIQNFQYITNGISPSKPIRAHMVISSNNDQALDSRTFTIKDNDSGKIYLDNMLITDTLISIKKKRRFRYIVISQKKNPNKCLGRISGPHGLKRADKSYFVNLIFNWVKEIGFTTVINYGKYQIHNQTTFGT